MTLMLNEEQELLQRSAREFVSGKAPLQRIRELRDPADESGFSRALWKEMASLGWLGIPIPEKFGGAGLGLTECSLVMEEMGRQLMPEPMLSTVLLGAQAILLGGDEAQLGEHLPAIASGERLFALAYQEVGGRYDPTTVETRAEAIEGGWKIDGVKTHVLDGHTADWFLVSARTSGASRDADGISLFLVPVSTPGVSVEAHVRVDGRRGATVRFESVRVDRGGVVGDVGAGAVVLDQTLDRATIGLSAEMLGSLSTAFEMTMDYLKTRVQFGVPIGSFQALKHRAAIMYVEIELARSARFAACQSVDDGAEATATARAASIVKARCSDVFVLVGNESIQMHGGIGMTDEHDIGFFLKRARAAEVTFGDAAYHRDRLARIDGY